MFIQFLTIGCILLAGIGSGRAAYFAIVLLN